MFYALCLDHKRHITIAMFDRKLCNCQVCDRKWLKYSTNQGTVYCFMCKPFTSYFDSPYFVSNSFDNWKKFEKISDHKNSIEQRSAAVTK